MAATFEWHVEMLRTDPTDDSFIKNIMVGIYGTENGVTKKTLWKVPFDGRKSDIPVNDWKSYSDLMQSDGEAILISWCKNKIGETQCAKLEDIVQGNINIHNDLALNPPRHLEAPANFSPKPTVTPSTNHQS